MEFQPVENTARFEMVYTYNSVTVENVFHVQSAITSWTNSDLTDSCNDFKTWYVDNIKAKQPSTCSLNKIIATSLHTQVSPKIEYVSGLPITGTGTGTPLPGNVTVAVKWVTGNRGRSARGRTFHIGLCEEQVTGNLLDETFYTALLTAYENLLPVVNNSSKSLRVVSLWHNKVRLAAGVTYPITGCSINSTIDTQRRRLV